MRHIPTLMTAATLMLLAALPAAAGEDTCGDLSTAELHACRTRLMESADAKLNTTYQALIARIRARFEGEPDLARKAEDSLRAAQRAWITMRDNDCAVAGMAYAGGTLEGVVAGSCLLDTTRARIAALEEIFANYRQH